MYGNEITLIPLTTAGNDARDERIRKYYISSIENNVMTSFGLVTIDTEKKSAVGKIYNAVESVNSDQMFKEKKKNELQNHLKFNMKMRNVKIISL